MALFECILKRLPRIAGALDFVNISIELERIQ